MEKEKITKPEEGNKKKHKRALLLLLLLLLAVVGVTVGAVVMTSSNAGENDGKLYYNVDQLEYMGGDGLSTRELGEDGYYSVTLAVDGEHKEFKVEDKALVDQIDNRDLMGLSVSKKGVITAVFNPEDVTGGEVVNRWFVTAADSTSVTVSDTGNDDGLTYTLQISEITGIYDITGAVTPVGQSTELKKGDCIRAFKDVESGIRYIFTVVADASAFTGATHTGYCEHCKTEVVWYEWEDETHLPTQAGHWTVMNDIKQERRQLLKETMLLVLDLNGKTVDGAKNQRVYSVKHDGATLVILDQSANRDGSIRTHGNTMNGGIVFVENGNFEMYSGTLDASDVDCDYQGLVIRTSKNTTSVMYGGTLIGGKTRCTFTGGNSKIGGAGGALYIGSHSTFTMKDGEIKDGQVEPHTYESGSRTFGLGGNVYCQDYATFTMEGGTISGGKSGNGGGNLYLEKHAVVTITGGEIKDGYAEYEGGNVMAHNGATLTIEGITISNGVAKKMAGGNVQITNDATATLKNVTLLSGNALRGGNLSVWKNAKKVETTNLVLKDGVAYKEGGNVSVWGKSAVNLVNCKITNGKAGTRGGNIHSFGDLTLTNCTVTGGKTTVYTDSKTNKVVGGFGGGNIFAASFAETKNGVKSYFGGNITLTNSTITGGVSENDNGGNVYFRDRANVVIGKNTVIENGSAKGSGGNIFVGDESKLVLQTTHPIQNGTAKNGGNIYVTKSTFDMADGSIKNGVASNQGGNLVVWGHATFNFSGGSIVDGEAVVRGGNISCLGTINMTGGTIANGKATSDKGDNKNGIGGNIYSAVYIATEKDAAGNSVKVPYRSTINVTGGTITNGSAANSRGGNFYLSESADLIVSGNVVIDKGVAKVNGGNIMAQGDSTVTLKDGVVVKDGTAGNEGGNIRLGNATLTITNATVIDGAAKTGGNITIDGATEAVVTNATIANGKATNGGNVYIYGKSTWTMNGGVIKDGVATNQAGNIGVWSQSTFNLTSGKILDGTAVLRGGNIVALGNINMSGGLISGGTATSDVGDNENGIGGNIYFAEYIATEKNAAGESVKVPYRSVFTITGGTITSGESLYSRGGNVYLGKNSDLIASGNVLFDKGVAAVNGGNLFVQSGSTITLNEGVVVQNGTATNDAGNIQVGSRGTLTVNNATVISGTAKNGGNICTSGTVVIQGENALVKNGKASFGGNIYAYESGDIKVNGGTVTFDDSFEQNTTRGGNIYSKGVVAINGGLIEKGVATATGGNIFSAENTTFTMTGGSVIGGHANRGGNIYADAEATSEITGGIITDGVANKDGGNIAAWSRGSLTVGGDTVIARGVGPDRGANITSLGSLTLKDNCVIGDETVVAEAKIGGNIYVASYVSGDTVVQSTFTMNGGTVQNGKAFRDDTLESEDEQEDAEDGGNIYMKDYVAAVINGGTIQGGVATTNGGNLSMNTTCTLAINGGTITRGTAQNVGGNVYYCNTYGDEEIVLTMTGGDITYGSAKRGGNFYLAGDSVMAMSGGTITDGTATGNDGGNIALWSRSELTVSGNAVISRGTAPNRGGDICALGNVTIKENAVIGDANIESKVTHYCSNCTWKKDENGDDHGKGYGGNIFIASYESGGQVKKQSILRMEGGTIQNGIATSGGCVYAKATAQIIMTNGATITSGTAKGANSNNNGVGGNIFITDGVIDMTASTISNGTSEVSRGGNVYMNKSNMFVRTGSVVSGGVADRNGGNIIANDVCDIQILGATVTGGTSRNGEGGNIRIGSSGTLTISNVAGADNSVIPATVSNGNAKAHGGNICIADTATLNINGATITGGITGNRGGNIYMYPSTKMNINGGTITNGTSTNTSSTTANGSAYTNNGGNIFAAASNTAYPQIALKGGVIVITGGKCGDTTSNLYLQGRTYKANGTTKDKDDFRLITEIGALQEGSSIGVDMNRTGYFTVKGIADQKDNVKYFFADLGDPCKIVYGPDASGQTDKGIRFHLK